jgi:hypothetical protein
VSDFFTVCKVAAERSQEQMGQSALGEKDQKHRILYAAPFCAVPQDIVDQFWLTTLKIACHHVSFTKGKDVKSISKTPTSHYEKRGFDIQPIESLYA